MAAAEQMEVKMIDGLAAVFAGVDDYAIALAEAFVAGNRGGCIQEMAEQVAVVSGCVVERGEVFTGNDENVDRRDRMNVGEGVAELVLVDGSGGNGTFGDLAEDAGHGVTSRARPVYNRAVEWGTRSGLLLEEFGRKRNRRDFGRHKR